MFMISVVALIFAPLVVGQVDQLENECHVLQTLDAHQDRLTSAEALINQLTTEQATLRKALIIAETEIATLKTSLTAQTTTESSGTDCLDGWIEFRGSCYLSVREVYTHQGAEVKCQELGGRLIHIETEAENQFIKDYIDTLQLPKGTYHSAHWIGIDDIVTEGVWKWTGTDSVATFFDWFSGELNGDTQENCGLIMEFQENTLYWNDGTCNYYGCRPLCER